MPFQISQPSPATLFSHSTFHISHFRKIDYFDNLLTSSVSTITCRPHVLTLSTCLRAVSNIHVSCAHMCTIQPNPMCRSNLAQEWWPVARSSLCLTFGGPWLSMHAMHLLGDHCKLLLSAHSLIESQRVSYIHSPLFPNS
jgi:hypothetical protein